VRDVAQRVAGGDVLQADERVDVAGRRLVDRVLLVGVHLEQLADALLLALGGVEHLGTGRDATGVHPDVGELAEERVSRDLERQGRERLGGGWLADDHLLLVVRGVTLHRRDVHRRGQVVDDGVEHGLHALVLDRRPAQHGIGLTGDGEGTDAALDLLRGQLLAAEVLLEQLVVPLGHGLDEPAAVQLDLLDHLGRYVLDRVVLALAHVVAPGERTTVDQVNDADEAVLGPDRQLQRQRLGLEPVDDRVDGEVEVRAELVHLVDEADARDVVLVRLAPHRLGLGLDTLLAVEDGNGTVEHAKRALHLDGEVDVTRGVDDVDLVALPVAGRRGGGDRDPALLLLLHPVHGRGAVVRLAHLVVDPGVEEDPLGHGGLAGVDVRHDADVADPLEVGEHVQCHV